MSDPDRIFLEAECCVDPNYGRNWNSRDIGPNEDCDNEAPWVEYVRADLMRNEVVNLKEQVAALESKEVCTQPHDDDVIEGCPYCKIEEFRKDVTKRMACKHLPSAWTKRWVCSYCNVAVFMLCEIIDNHAAKTR